MYMYTYICTYIYGPGPWAPMGPPTHAKICENTRIGANLDSKDGSVSFVLATAVLQKTLVFETLLKPSFFHDFCIADMQLHCLSNGCLYADVETLCSRMYFDPFSAIIISELNRKSYCKHTTNRIFGSFDQCLYHMNTTIL
jgi:hypothetical protein